MVVKTCQFFDILIKYTDDLSKDIHADFVVFQSTEQETVSIRTPAVAVEEYRTCLLFLKYEKDVGSILRKIPKVGQFLITFIVEYITGVGFEICLAEDSLVMKDCLISHGFTSGELRRISIKKPIMEKGDFQAHPIIAKMLILQAEITKDRIRTIEQFNGCRFAGSILTDERLSIKGK